MENMKLENILKEGVKVFTKFIKIRMMKKKISLQKSTMEILNDYIDSIYKLFLLKLLLKVQKTY